MPVMWAGYNVPTKKTGKGSPSTVGVGDFSAYDKRQGDKLWRASIPGVILFFVVADTWFNARQIAMTHSSVIAQEKDVSEVGKALREVSYDEGRREALAQGSEVYWRDAGRQVQRAGAADFFRATEGETRPRKRKQVVREGRRRH